MFNWLTRTFRPSTALVAEGSSRVPGPYFLSSGWLPAGTPWNFWQAGQSVQPYGECSAMVEACVSAYAQTVAMCQGDHWRALPNGGRERVTTSSLSRLLRTPNEHESASDFLLNLTRRLYSSGEAFAVALRNDRREIAELHLMRNGTVQIAQDGSVFYGLNGNDILERRLDFSMPVPARDVLHVRLQTPRHPLRGESPILAAALDIAMGNTSLSQQIAYYVNQARPSYVLQTDLKLNPQQAEEIREHWNAQTQAISQGGTPILMAGFKAQQMQGSAEDGQLAELLKMNDERIAAVFRVPLSIVNLVSGGGAQGSTEAQMTFWIATGLGFCLNHVEVAFDRLFGLRGVPLEYTEFDTSALLRSAFKDRVEGMARSVISGIHAPNEARAEFELPEVAFGSEPRVQQQVVPLSAASGIPSAPGPEAAPAAPGPEPEKDTEDAGRSFRSTLRQRFYADAA